VSNHCRIQHESSLTYTPCRTFQTRNTEDFFYLAGVLRLATKYLVHNIRHLAIHCLASTWAYTLEGHDLMVRRALDSPASQGITFPYVHPLHVLNLAHEANVRIILPSVYYFLSLYQLEDILRADHPKLVIEHPSKPSSEISDSDIRNYTLMFQHRLAIILEFTRQICGKRVVKEDECLTGGGPNGPCQRAFGKLTSKFSKAWAVRTGPLHFMIQATNTATSDMPLCDICKATFEEDVRSMREEIWSKLPSVVGLPGWKELLASDLSLITMAI
jgi:hypothetical protein